MIFIGLTYYPDNYEEEGDQDDRPYNKHYYKELLNDVLLQGEGVLLFNLRRPERFKEFAAESEKHCTDRHLYNALPAISKILNEKENENG